MQRGEEKYREIIDQIIEIFSEMESIVKFIKDDFLEEKKQDPRLTITEVENRLNQVSYCVNSFKGYGMRSKTNWSLEKYCNYVKESLRSFHREFDNPFLGSQKWYQRIVQLQDQLSEQSRELDKLIDKE